MSRHTAFGKLLRRRRTEADLSLRDVAESLAVSHVFLGEVERGEKRLKEEWWPRLAGAIPGLTLAEMKAAHLESQPVQLEIAGRPEAQRDLTIAFARSISEETLSSAQIEKMLKILRGEE